MKNTKYAIFLTSVIIVGTIGASRAATPTFTTLQPGQFREIDQNLQINIVFVGYEPGSGPRDINEEAFRAYLPQSYRSVNRVPSYYGLPDSQIRTGTAFTYNYNLVYANLAFENAF